MVASIAGAKNVVATEQPELIPLLRTNIRRNFQEPYPIQARELSWGKAETKQFCNALTEQFDLILSCDCIYQPLYGDSWKLLAQTLDELCHRKANTFALVSVERRNEDGVNDFLEYVQSHTLLTCELISTVSKTRTIGEEGTRLEIYKLIARE